MLNYIFKRLILIIPTLLGILAVNFIIIQAAPGGPVEKAIAQIKGNDVSVTSRFTSSGGEQLQSSQSTQLSNTSQDSKYRGSQGIDPDLIKELEKQYGFDKPPLERFINMLKNYLVFDFGESFYKDKSVIDLIIEKLPVSISLGLWTTLIVYLISIPLGIKKAVRDGSDFDIFTSSLIIIGYAIPGFLFAIFLIVIFAGGSYLDIFPLRGLISDDWENLSFFNKIVDYFNNNPLFTELRERNFQRISSIIFDNEQTIKQIDKLLDHYTTENKTKTTQLYIDNKDVRPNELIKTKISLQNENQELKKENLTTKETVMVINEANILIENNSLLSNKMVYYPLLFLFIYIIISLVIGLYLYLDKLDRAS